jgi:hypothetical protein
MPWRGRPAADGARGGRRAADEAGTQLDVFGLDRRAMAVAIGDLAETLPDPRAEVASTDHDRRGALEDAGFRLDSTRAAEVAGAQISLCTYLR